MSLGDAFSLLLVFPMARESIPKSVSNISLASVSVHGSWGLGLVNANGDASGVVTFYVFAFGNVSFPDDVEGASSWVCLLVVRHLSSL